MREAVVISERMISGVAYSASDGDVRSGEALRVPAFLMISDGRLIGITKYTLLLAAGEPVRVIIEGVLERPTAETVAMVATANAVSVLGGGIDESISR